MPNTDHLNEGERELEHQLRQLTPVQHGISRDAMMFRAGQQAAARQVRGWQSIAGALTLCVICLGGLGIHRHTSPTAPDLVSNESASTPSVVSGETRMIDVDSALAELRSRPPANAPYLTLRHLLITEGVDALPPPAAGPVSDESIRSVATELRRS